MLRAFWRSRHWRHACFSTGEDDLAHISPRAFFAGSDDLMSRIFAAEKNEAPIAVGSQFQHCAEGRLSWPHQLAGMQTRINWFCQVLSVLQAKASFWWNMILFDFFRAFLRLDELFNLVSTLHGALGSKACHQQQSIHLHWLIPKPGRFAWNTMPRLKSDHHRRKLHLLCRKRWRRRRRSEGKEDGGQLGVFWNGDGIIRVFFRL